MSGTNDKITPRGERWKDLKETIIAQAKENVSAETTQEVHTKLLTNPNGCFDRDGCSLLTTAINILRARRMNCHFSTRGFFAKPTETKTNTGQNLPWSANTRF